MSYDLLIVGGGIHGAGIARDAAGRGLSVLLVEQHSLASHTSSASSKLVHRGLRYLEYLKLGLVRESLSERESLLAIAPHLVSVRPQVVEEICPPSTRRIPPVMNEAFSLARKTAAAANSSISP